MLTFVGCADLNADTSLSLWYYGIVETCNEDAFFLHLSSILLALGSVVDHNGTDGTLGGLAVETFFLHATQEVVGVLVQLVLQFVGFAHHLEHTDTGGNQAGGHGVGEEVGTAALAQHIDDFLLSGCESTHSTAKGFTQCSGKNLDLAAKVVAFGYTTTGLTDDAGTVTLVNHNHSVVLLSQLVNLVQGADISVHREYAVCYDNAEAVLLGSFQLFLQVGHIGIGITVALSFAKADTVDDGSMVESIGDDGILVGQQGLENTTVGIETGGIQDGIFCAEELGNLLLQLLVEVLTAADEAYAGHAKATLVHTFLGSLDEFLVASQAQVVVSTEVKALLSLDQNLCTLRALDDTFVLVQSGCLYLSQFLLQMFLKF